MDRFPEPDLDPSWGDELEPRWYDRLFMPPLRLLNRWVMFLADVIERGLSRERRPW